MAQWQRIHLPVQEIQDTRVQSLGQEDPLEKEMATHSSILATEEPGGLQSMGLQRVRHDLATKTTTTDSLRRKRKGPCVSRKSIKVTCTVFPVAAALSLVGFFSLRWLILIYSVLVLKSQQSICCFTRVLEILSQATGWPHGGLSNAHDSVFPLCWPDSLFSSISLSLFFFFSLK